MVKVEGKGGRGARRAMLAVSVATALALGAAGQALAQDGGAAPAATVQELDAITVTAQKRAQLLHEVPSAVSAINAETLTQQNLIQVKDFYMRVPGLSYIGGSGLGMNSISLRGVSTGYGGNPTVGIVIDDVPYGSSTGVGYGNRLMPDLDPASLDHIEVLRGPQGTLYGASSLGGLLKYVTKTPDTDYFHGRAELTTTVVEHGGTGNAGRASVNLPLADGVMGASVSAFYREDPGYIDAVNAGVEDANSGHAYGGRAALYIRPNERLSIHLSALSQDRRGFGAGSIDADADYQLVNPDLVSTSLTVLPRYRASARLYTGRVEADLGWAELTSITAFGRNKYLSNTDTTTRFSPLLPMFGLDGARTFLVNSFDTEKFTQELRLASVAEGPLRWMVGAFYTKEDTVGDQVLDAEDGSGNVLLNMLTSLFPSTFKEKALFADVGYDFTDRFTLQAGLRYSENDQTYDELSVGALAGPDPQPLSGRSSDNSVTWLVSPQFQVGEDSMVYLRAASGYRPGGPNTDLPSIPDSYKPDKSVNLELGWKGTALDNTVSYAAALFRIDWEDIQLSLVDPATQFAYFGNGGEARSQGLELEGSWRPWLGMTLSGSVAFTDAELTEPLAGGGVAADLVGGPGDRLPYVARRTGSLSADQTFDLGSWMGSIGGSVSYTGDRVGAISAAEGIPRARAPGFTQIDLRGSLSRDQWTISAFVRNLGDKRGVVDSSLRTATNPANGYSLGYILPRSYGVSIAYDF